MQQEKNQDSSNWTEIIKPQRSLFDLRLKDVWNYKDLLFMFVKRDFVANYKQTILGPLWFIIQPVLTTLMYTIVFGNFAKISTNGQPKILFYLAGVTIWNYFSDTFNRTSSVFTSNANIFGKVYFPRLIVPLSIIVSGLIRFSIQFTLFMSFLIYYLLQSNDTVNPNMYVLLTPVLLFLMAGLALGAGMIISSMTTKYRDFTYLVSFGVTLLMYATPVIYPIEFLPQKYKTIIMLNPLSGIVETFRYAWLGSGSFSWQLLGYSFCFVIMLLMFGIVIFNKVEKNFMDTV
jgi:lipopolysaccharide transport system permease protein